MPEPGATLGPYRIRRLLGKGGMGEVYLAEDTRLNRSVALKILPPQFTGDPDRLARFTQEAKAASALNHPNIVTIHEIGESAGTRYISTEFIDGETLRVLIRQGGFSLKEALDVAAQAAGALAAAHQAGIVHRDIKPDNIMLRRDGYVKILDFGLAKLTEKAPPSEDADTEFMDEVSTKAGAVMGTTQYMSPEQARGRPLDGRSDIFSFGATLYEMIAGRPPFHGETASHLIVALLESEPEPLSQIAPQVPREVEAIVEKALAKDREERYQTAQDLAVDLKRARRRLDAESSGLRTTSTSTTGNPPSSGPVTPPPSSIPPPASPKRKLPVAVWPALVVLVLAAGFGLYRWHPWNGHPAFEHFQLTQLTSSGKASNPAISPDGRYVVYQVCDKGLCGLWLRQTGTDSNVAIVPPGEGGYWGLTYSSDGNSIYYLHNEKRIGALYQMPALGGPSRKILDNVRSAAIHPDGKTAAILLDLGRDVSEVEEINLDGSAPKKLFSKRAPETILGLAYAPDSRSLTYTTQIIDPVQTTIRRHDFAGNERELSSKKWIYTSAPLWLPGGREIFVTGNDPQTVFAQSLWRIDARSGEASRVTNDLNTYQNASVSQDGRSLVMARTDTRATLWSARPGEPASAHQITTAESRRDGSNGTALMKDGAIVFDAITGDEVHLWICDPDGGNARQLTSGSPVEFTPQVTPDSSAIVYVALNKSYEIQIFAVDADGHNARQLSQGAGTPSFALSGADLFYQEFGRRGFFRTTVKGERPGSPPVAIPVQDEFVEVFAVSPDGKTIAYVFEDPAEKRQHRIGYIPVTGGPRVRTGPVLPDEPSQLFWTADGKAVTYLLAYHGVTRLVKQPLEGAGVETPPSTLLEVPNESVFSYALSADGSQIVYSRGASPSDIVLMTDQR